MIDDTDKAAGLDNSAKIATDRKEVMTMYIVKRVFGAVLAAIGGVGVILVLLMVLNDIMERIEWGTGSDGNALAFILTAGVLSACVLAWGIKLIRSPRTDVKEPQDFTAAERERERATESFTDMQQREEERNYVPAAGPYIWKYRKGGSSGRLFRRYRIFCLAGLVAGTIVAVSVLVLASARLPGDTRRMVGLISVLVLAGILVAGALVIGRRTYGMFLTFARDSENNMYLFDYAAPEFQRHLQINVYGTGTASNVAGTAAYFYNAHQEAKMIEAIDEERLIERIMASGHVYPYGRRIIRIEGLREWKTSCRITCVLSREDGSTFKRKVTVPGTYDNYTELIYSFRRLYI